GGVIGVVVVVIGKRQRVAVAAHHRRGFLRPTGGCANVGNDGGTRGGRVLRERGQRPVICDGVWTSFLVPDAQAGRSAGGGEGLGDGAVTVGGARAAELRAKGTAVTT